jgi:hypothetical protein
MTNGATAVATMVPGQLTVCTYGGFAPVCYKNPAGQLIGLDVSFLTRFAESLGLAILTFEKPFDGIWTLPGADVCDVAGAGVMRRDDRPAAPGATRTFRSNGRCWSGELRNYGDAALNSMRLFGYNAHQPLSPPNQGLMPNGQPSQLSALSPKPPN